MSVYNVSATKNLNAAKRRRQEELIETYEGLGGGNPAYKPIQNNVLARRQNLPSIPALEKAVVEQYESAPRTMGKGLTPVSARANSTTHNRMNDIPSIANTNHRNAQHQYANVYNDILNRQLFDKFSKLGIKGVSDLPEIITTQTIMGQGNNMYGKPTPEMQAVGITQEDLQRFLDPQIQAQNEARVRAMAEKAPVLASGAAVISRPIESAEGVLQNLGEYVTGKPLNQTYTPSTIIRETVNEGIKTKPGRIAYSVANSLGDMGLALLTQNPTAIAAIMGTEKASDVMNDANARGLTPDQIVGEGALSGASTALTEMIPFGGFLRGGTVAHGIVSEGLQEGAENILDNVFDLAVTRAGGNLDKSTLVGTYNAYVNAGYDPEQALRETLKGYGQEVLMDTVLGGLTGGLMQGISNAAQGRTIFGGQIPNLETQAETEANEEIPEAKETVNNTNENEEIPVVQQPAEQSADNSALKTIKEKANAFLAKVMKNKGQSGEKRNQVQLSIVPTDVADMVSRASGGTVNIADKYLAIEGSKLWHEIVNHSDAKAEREIGQIPLNSSDISEIVDTMYHPDIVENISDNYKSEQRKTFALIKKAEGYIVLVEAVGGRYNPNIVPEQILHLGDKKMQRFLNGEISIGDILYDNSQRKGDVEGNARDIKNRVIAAQLAYDNVAPAQTSETYRHSPLFDSNIPQVEGNVNLVRGSEENALSGEGLPAIDSRSQIERQIDDIADNLFDLIEDGKMTSEDYENAMREMSELAKNDKALQDKVFNLLTEASNEYRAKRYNMDVDPDIENAESEEELGNIVDEIVESLDEITEDATFPTSQPGVNTGRLKESQTYTGTGEKSGMTQEEKVRHSERAVRGETGGILYQEVGEQESVEQAQKNLEEKGEPAEAQRLFHKNGWNQVDTDEAMTLLKQTREEAERIEANGGDASNEWDYAADLFIKIQTEATNHAQALQALAKWSRVRADGSLTAEGRLAAGVIAATQATKVTNSERNINAELKDKQFQKKFKFDKEFVADFLKAAKEFDKQKNNLTVREQAVGEARLARMIKNQIPVTLRQRITSILMDDMLFSIRTLISRNAGGNAGLALVDQTITKLIAGGVDRAASKLTGRRTTTGFTFEGAKRYLGGIKEGATRTAADYFKDDVNTWRPGQENDFKALIDENGRLFNTEGKSKILNNAAKVGNFLDRIVSFGLTFGDNPFYTAAYRQSEYEFDKLREQGWFDKDAQGKPISDEEFEKIKKSHSVINALTAVYQNDTAISDGLMKIKKGLEDASNGLLGFDAVTQASMPFVKTPANVALTAFEYSPFGIIKNAVQTFKEVSADYKRAHGQQVVGDLTFNQQRFVRETSRNLVGTMLYVLAIGMAKAGLLTGAYSDDDDMKAAQKEAGMQEYAFVSPFTGNQWQTSWIPVLGNSAVAGAATWDAINNSKDGNAVLEGLKAGASSQFENSMLQGLQRLFGTQSNYSSEGILQNVGNTIKSAGTQLIPSIVRQTAAALDPYQRDTRGIEENDRYTKPIIASLPFLRENLQPRIGRTGEELEQNAGRNAFQKWMDNLVNPAIVTTPNAVPDAVRDEAMRLYDSLEGEDIKVARSAFEPYVNVKQITTDSYTPTEEEYTQYQRDAYGQMNSVAEQMIGTDYYQNLSDLAKAKALAKIYEAVRDSVRCDTVDGNVADLDAAARIYNQEGADALIEYVMTGQYLNQMGVSNSQSNREYVQNQLQSGNYEALNQNMETAQELSEAGFNENLTLKYEHATQYIPSLTPTEFAQTWNDIDGTIKPNGTVSQDEILAYLNQNPTSWNESDATMYWQAYLQNPTYQPYFDAEEGIWKKHKP